MSSSDTVLRSIVEVTGNGKFLVTLNDLAVHLKIHRDSAKRWVTKLVSMGRLRREYVSERRGRGVAKVLRLSTNESTSNCTTRTIGGAPYNAVQADADGASVPFPISVHPPVILVTSKDLLENYVGEKEMRSGASAPPITTRTSENRVEDTLGEDALSALDNALSWTEDCTELVGPTRNKFGSQAVQPYPFEVPFVRTPPQPRLTGVEGDDRRLLRTAYLCTRAKRFPRAANRPLPRNIELVAGKALDAMRKSGIDEPYAWAMFRQCWSKEARPFLTVFSVSALSDKKTLESFHRDAPRLRDGWCFLPPSFHVLVKLLNKAKSNASAPHITTLEEAVAAARAVLSDERYKELLSSALVEARVMRARMHSRIDNGEWVWNQIRGTSG